MRGRDQVRQETARTAAWLAAFAISAATAQGQTAVQEIPRVFDSDPRLEIQIRAPWRKMLRERIALPEHPAELVYVSTGGARVALQTRVRLRGISRLEHCAYPPLTLYFEAAQIVGTQFEGQAVVHATIPCRPNPKYEGHIVQEYLAYRTYELLAEEALRTRLVRLDLWNTVTRKSLGTVDAFLVEDFDLAAERLGKRRVQDRSVPRGGLDAEATARHALFQFMIGHTDWSILAGPPGKECCHNLALFAPLNGPPRTGLLPIPFDFDGSGLVDTGDARPNPTLGITDVRQRRYRGFCAHNEALRQELPQIEQLKADLQTLFSNPELPHPKARRRSWLYLDTFFALLSDSGRVERQIFERCRER